ncbi:MAG TPA: ABC transporter ATP-binding protein/permease [Stellaceae bacterium]|nr:ABC transporter ATP-binding protein/permease [Stellaceae bacterium]
METSKRSILREAWRIARPYWFSEERWVARGLLAAVLAINLIQVWINVRLNSWRNDFYNSLQNYDKAAFFYQIGLFALLAGAFILLLVYGTYLQQMLQIRWRRWMTDVYLREWLADKTYYRLQLTGDSTDNPDQRISEDLNFFPAQTLNLSLGLLTNFVQAVSFSVILWELSGPLVMPLGSWGAVTIPGYMFWAVVLYTAIATWLAIRLGRPLINLNFAQQRFEADFRFSLVRLRENTESVAFYGGEERERDIFDGRFRNVFANYLAIMIRTRLLGLAQFGSAQAAVVFPYLVAAPRYFGERLKLGEIQQVADAFIQLQGSLAYIISSYNDIATWLAVVRRLSTFRDSIDRIQAETQRPQPIAIQRGGKGIAVADLALDLPDGSPLLERLNLDVTRGQALLVKGPTGTGKSTLLRAIAGLWPFGRGHVRLDAGRAFFLPQKPYIPLGDLRHALVYPDADAEVSQERLVEVLRQVGLGRFAAELDKPDMWAQRLSGGEQQRLAVARVLLAKPQTIFLDEATSALDEEGEAELYRLLKEAPWRPTIVSVGHRSTLRAFHDSILPLVRAARPQKGVAAAS